MDILFSERFPELQRYIPIRINCVSNSYNDWKAEAHQNSFDLNLDSSITSLRLDFDLFQSTSQG